MNNSNYFTDDSSSWGILIILAGLLGGLAEIAWVSVYSYLTPVSAIEISRQVLAAVIPSIADSYFAPLLGVFIHLLLSVLLAIVFAATVLRPVARRYGSIGITLACLMTLAVVWKINFFVVLPLINPAFILLLPYSISLISKLLFGATMAWVLVIKSPLHEGIRR